MHSRIKKIHEKALRLVCKEEKNLSLDDLLEKDKSVSNSPKKSTNISDRNL